MSADDVFSRRWVLAEDELLKLLWRCQAGANPDVVLLEMYAHCREDRRRRPHPLGGHTRRLLRDHELVGPDVGDGDETR